MSPSDLAQVLGNLKVDLPEDTIGFESSEDCAVFPLDENHYLIQSVDFFTPIVDDPYTFGQIAAANSLSDIYAMGGMPLHALNIAEFPSDDLPLEILTEIMQGGLEITKQANIPILGGHTIKDPVPKYGLVVTGRVKKKNLTLNSTAKAGDVLILTKPLGSGIIATAIKKDKAPRSIMEEAVNVMTNLNSGGAKAMNAVGVNACTDITGYGLLGHLLEMCEGSKISATIECNEIPLMQGVFELAQKGFIPGGTKRNLDHVIPNVNFSKNISQEQKYLLADAQTSGGLLISVPKDKAEDLQNLLMENQCLSSSVIGQVYNSAEFPIYVD
ncbi:MAG TPA: selenide, water dikinase SelD [Candidatus Marinimicrobia bacterium]|nr:selenide, water dikinase SelD [Candidatus Neomarinimicrobiota bacterium]MDP7465403.1 selenide, water dikinase SelD [Candidatus Neomarinimicrobiota bacterium]HJM84258.1 selenide, water dikinase SelD [Candidatus Neomarinimicrobiota bacterium]